MSSFIKVNQKICKKFDEIFLPKSFVVDGLKDFQQVASSYLSKNQTVIDIGGGKIPFVNAELKDSLNLKVIGLDISEDELNLAPSGIYDKKIVSSIENFKPKTTLANFTICEAVLEHVKDNKKAIKAISSSTKRNGYVMLFIPCKNAIFARLNMILPEKIKKSILYSIFPESRHGQGFPAYYKNCSPSEIKKICEENDLIVESIKTYHYVTYFTFLFPLHITWRILQIFSILFMRKNACEAFTIVAKKV